MHRSAQVLLTVLTLVGLHDVARADHCMHTARISSEWMNLKNYIDSNDDDGLSFAETQYISREEHRLLVPTIRLMTEAANDPRPQARSTANRLQNDLARLDQIDDDGDWYEDSRIIFRIAADLATLARICASAPPVGGVGGGSCDQLVSLAQHWERLRIYIDSNDDDGLNFAEAQYISREEHRLHAATMPLLSQTLNDPRPPVRNLAMRLYGDLQRLDQIDDDDNWTEDSIIIFRVAREIMRFEGMCRATMPPPPPPPGY